MRRDQFDPDGTFAERAWAGASRACFPTLVMACLFAMWWRMAGCVA